MRVILEHMPNDATSALFRSLNPDTWMWAGVNPQLMAEVATMARDLRFITAARILGDDMPTEWQPARYGPPQEESEEAPDEATPLPADRDARALAVVKQIRAEMAVAG